MKKIINDAKIDEASKLYARGKIIALKDFAMTNFVCAENEVLENIIRLSYKDGFADGLICQGRGLDNLYTVGEK